jgi:hypothetical protein
MPADRRAPRAPKSDSTRWNALLAYLRSQTGRTIGGVTESGSLGNIIREEGAGAYAGVRYVVADDGTNTTTALTTDDIPNEQNIIGTLAPTFAPPVENGRGMIDYGDLTPGLVMPQPQRFDLLRRPAGFPLPALGGALIEPWEFEQVIMPWMLSREAGAGECYVQVQWFGSSSAANPLRISLLNTAYNQSLALDQGAYLDDEVNGGGAYRWRRTRQVLLSEITTVGRKGLTMLHVQIAAPNGGVEIYNLSVYIGWRR